MYDSHWIFFLLPSGQKKQQKKKQWDLVPQRPIKREREKTIISMAILK